MLTINEIKNIIPHRAPFLLIDKVEELIPGERATAYKNVTFNEYFFEGHFPQEPVMPGVLIIEALAQTGAVAILSLEELKGKIAYFGGIKSARFRGKVIPGDVLKLDVEIIKRRGPIGVGQATATVNGKVVTECELTFVVGE
ncbi:MAG: 3-hydroxyacyl-[acyl-carrier-protein] dehydratase FabZ [Firmicutes bacterium HGW-Firmicutes-1]|jgi:3-hydroxyacyl-[acyl-carrier-protein] dehydratase|nr:MAG: 3-hydroxyacyl-[acyl-carrier-protein] dehydratase FabZ [Firmicutes bacterium HGW-Firmicutes-1]